MEYGICNEFMARFLKVHKIYFAAGAARSADIGQRLVTRITDRGVIFQHRRRGNHHRATGGMEFIDDKYRRMQLASNPGIVEFCVALWRNLPASQPARETRRAGLQIALAIEHDQLVAAGIFHAPQAPGLARLLLHAQRMVSVRRRQHIQQPATARVYVSAINKREAKDKENVKR